MILAIIQARMGSTRLPGKILLPLADSRPVLGCMLSRVKKTKLIGQVIVATTDQAEDNKTAAYLAGTGQEYFRGSEGDVLDRYYQAAKKAGASRSDAIVRLTADCPVIDPRVIDEVIKTYEDHDYDFVSNSLPPYSYPDGMDVEVFSFANLEKAWREARLPSHREHVTFYFWQSPERFKIYSCKYSRDLSSYRLTLDYPEDYQVLAQVYKHFGGLEFSMEDIVKFLDEHPAVKKLNAGIKQNAGWQSSLEKDRQAIDN